MKQILICALFLMTLVSSSAFGFFGYEECYGNYEYRYECNCLNGCPRCR